MRRKTRTKINKVLRIIGIILGILIIITSIIFLVKLNQKQAISYEDVLVGKNYFSKITINVDTKEVKRDNIKTTLMDEFGITKEKEEILFSQTEELNNFLKESSFNVSIDSPIYTITNHFQTKRIIVQAEKIMETVKGEKVKELQNGLFLLSFESEKLASAMYKYYEKQPYIKKVFYDEIFINNQINDESQTMYGNSEINLNKYHTLGVTSLGLDNYHKIINENGNAQDVTVATIGYGFNVEKDFFSNRVSEKSYNFILKNKKISENNSQSNRIAEVIIDSTTPNVKIMPLVVINEEGYTSISAISEALIYGIKNSDIICYEIIHDKNDVIDLIIENAFKSNIPICSVATSLEKESYPANHPMTIATASLNRENSVSSYSAEGDFIDFSIPSTDVAEIFNSNNAVSRWSGAQYANAGIVAEIALIKTYNKQATILEIYNFLRNFCIDLGENGKDKSYGYGMPQFSNLKISDIDKIAPEITELEYENDTWELLKQIKLKSTDNIRIFAWGICDTEEIPKQNEWKKIETIKPNIDEVSEIKENGIYYLYVIDSAGNVITKKFEINKIDNIPPKITYSINKDKLDDGYVTISVIAEDNESGLKENAYSWDKQNWSNENKDRKITENGTYKIYVTDNLGNISEQEIEIDVLSKEGTYQLGEGNIISNIYVSAEWDRNVNNNVQITLNKDLDIAGWQITETGITPIEFVEVNKRPQNLNQQENTTASNTLQNTISNTVSSTTSNTTNTSDSINNVATSNNIQENIRNSRISEPIKITTMLNTETVYYIWVKDSQGKISYQMFTIDK